MASTLENSNNFIPETVPAYSARKVFEELKSQPDYQNFTYKEATLNPTNPQDKADSFETKGVGNHRFSEGISRKDCRDSEIVRESQTLLSQ